MWQVEIYFLGDWFPIGPEWTSKGNAEGAIRAWCERTGHKCGVNGIRAVPADDEYVTLDSVLGRGRHEDESGVDLARAMHRHPPGCSCGKGDCPDASAWEDCPLDRLREKGGNV